MLDQLAASLLEGLNEEQQRAVVTVDGPVLVVAGPGSGKTRVLTHRIAYLIQERNVLPDQILAVTFTNKAAREMRDRIERLVGQRAAAGLVMGTFHSFGVRVLRQNPGIVADRLGLLPNFLIYDDADQLDVAKRAIVEIGLDPSKEVAPRRVLSRISAAKSMLVTAEEFASQTEGYGDEIIARAFAAYQRLLRKANAVDFDDLLAHPIRLFDEAPALLERYQARFRYILVDEYQDTNRVQYVLVTALAAQHRNLFVVGDPDQSIYGWRQADIRNILDFEKDYPDATRIHLELNYRSTQRIVDAADRVIRVNTQRIDRRLRTNNPEGEDVVLKELSDGAHEAGFIVAEIRRLMHRLDLGGDSFAVMYRTTAQSRVLEEAFRVSDVPYRIVGGVRFYDRKEVKDALAVFRLLHNPADEVSLQRVLDNMPIGRGLGPKALDALRLWAIQQGEPLLSSLVAFSPSSTSPVPPAPLSGSGRAAAQRVGAAFASLRQKVGTLPLTELLDAVLDATGYQDAFDRDSEEEMQRWANVLELRSDLAKYDLLEPEDALATYLEQVALVSDVDTMEDDPRGRVTLITLHSAKGLEFPVVFIAGVEDGLLPINRAIEAEWSDPLPMEEERRLFYVGITRAQQLLYVTFAARRISYGSYQPGLPSRFLASLAEVGVRSSVRSGVRTGRLSERVRAPSEAIGVDSSRRYAAATVGASPATSPSFQRVAVGQRVFHTKFGEGVVLGVVDESHDQKVTVDFKREGTKTVLASLARFDLIE
jgi:DNA helicase-2/ATP-dependent DNA helicase PcrA